MRTWSLILCLLLLACGEAGNNNADASPGSSDNAADNDATCAPDVSACETTSPSMEELDPDGDGLDEDGNPVVPSAEVCGDNIDNDLDSETDTDCDPDADLDNDGFSQNEGDCNDGRNDTHPDGTEVADDGIDQDCNGSDASNATFSGIQSDILTPRCTACHSGGSPPQGLNLSAGNAYNNLVNVDAGQASLKRVKPGDPDNSYLIHKLAGTQIDAGGSGLQMPRLAPELSNTEFHQIRNWIDGGAPDN